MDVRTYGHMNVCTEFLPILQDFVPCQGCCPKSVVQTDGKFQGGVVLVIEKRTGDDLDAV